MYKHYIAIWTVDEDLRRGNKNSIHTFKGANGEKYCVASKLHRIDDETLNNVHILLGKCEKEQSE